MKNCEPFVFGPLFAMQSKLAMIGDTARTAAAEMCQFHEATNEFQGERGDYKWPSGFAAPRGERPV